MSGWDRRGPRTAFTPTERGQVQVRDNFTCYVCGGFGTEVDHIIPLAEDGPHALSNAGCICTECHAVKSREEAVRGYQRRQAKLRLPPERHPFDME